jgi:heat induced stress protein YflT
MSGKNRVVFGIYSSQLDAENAVNGLKLAGFRNTDISILFPENVGTKDLALEKSTKAPEGTAAGAGSGALVGGIIGWLAGAGALMIPGLGLFVAAGPIMGLLSGIGAGGVLGGIVGALVGLGTPEYEAKRYEGRIRKGGILLSVHCDDSDWVKTARTILEQTGAEDISTTSEAKADFAKSDRPRSRIIETGA